MPKDTTEADESEPEPKEKKGIIDSLPVKRQMMKSVANIQEEDSNDSPMKERKSEDTTKADEPEPEHRERKGIFDSHPVRKQMMRSVDNIKEEDSDDSSMKECEKGRIKEIIDFEQRSNSARCDEDENANETVAIRLRVTEKDSNETANTREVTAESAQAEIDT